MGVITQHEKVIPDLFSIRTVIADEHYYKKTLEERRDILSAPDIKFLCKTIIFENTAYDAKFEV